MKGVTDLYFAAYLIISGYIVKDYQNVTERRLKFFFEIDDDKYKEMRIAFASSEASKIKQTIEELKDLKH